MLEIGVSFGGSLQAWKKYFGRTSIIVGVDINEDVCAHRYLYESGVLSFCFDASIPENLAAFYSASRDASGRLVTAARAAGDRGVPLLYDIIIDDGSHRNSDVIRTFKASFEHMSVGGVYIVEDVLW